MLKLRRSGNVTALILIVATSLGTHETAAASKRFGLVEAFSGVTYGTGTFTAPLLGVERRVSTTLRGSRSGNRFVVAEQINFADGERQRKTWRFVKTGLNTWAGRREDVVGIATVTEDGGVVTMLYDAEVNSASTGKTVLSFYDRIYRGADGQVINETIASKYGLPIGFITLKFRR